MATDSLDLEIFREGDWDGLFRRLHAGSITGARSRRTILHQWLAHLGEFATAQQRIYAPHGESGYLHQHIGMSGERYLPGGAGGGGTYEIVSGVRRGTSLHPIYVHQGTKNLGDDQLDALINAGQPGMGVSMQGRIYARGDRRPASVIETQRRRAGGVTTEPFNVLRRAALTFQKRGEPRKFRQWVTGQRPQPFVYWSFVHTAVYAKGQMRAIARQLI